MLHQFPIKPLLATKGTSLDTAFEVIGWSATMARLVLKRGTPERRDGSPIEEVLAVYGRDQTVFLSAARRGDHPGSTRRLSSRLSPLIPTTWLTFPARVPEPLPFNATSLG
jgi:hypothetical protein